MNLARKAAEAGERPAGVGGGFSDLATWNKAARLSVKSEYGGLPVAALQAI